MGKRPTRDQKRLIRDIGESVLAVAAATGLAAVLDIFMDAGALGLVYLLAVLYVAIRHGLGPALATAVLSVTALNFFFIEPRFRPEVARAENVADLGVLLVAAVVVGRLAADARRRTVEAREREEIATAREREARVLAAAASAALGGVGLQEQFRNLEHRVAAALGSPAVRIDLGSVPRPRDGETVTRVASGDRSAWLYLREHAGWEKEDARRIGDALGKIVGLALERDRLARRSAEVDAAREADLAKTALLHAISHDLRSPLTAITTATDGLDNAAIPATDRQELVAVLRAETSRLSRLVDDLLDISRIEAQAVSPAMDWCDLHDAVAAGVAHARALHGDHPVTIDVPADMPLVRADPAQLERVLANLIENAVKFSPADAPVTVVGAATGDRVILRVLDAGPGVPAGDRNKIFEPFYRGSARSGRGSGLGLAIARGFVEANGGQISLQVGARGGTSLIVSFPLERQPATA